MVLFVYLEKSKGRILVCTEKNSDYRDCSQPEKSLSILSYWSWFLTAAYTFHHLPLSLQHFAIAPTKVKSAGRERKSGHYNHSAELMSRCESRYKIKGGGGIQVLIVNKSSICSVWQYAKLNVDTALAAQGVVAKQDDTACDQALPFQHKLSKEMSIWLGYNGNYCTRYTKYKGLTSPLFASYLAKLQWRYLFFLISLLLYIEQEEVPGRTSTGQWAGVWALRPLWCRLGFVSSHGLLRLL